MKILGIIPARGGSKGVPNKNIKVLDGKPLIQYTSDVAKKSKLLDKVIVSTDSLEIFEICKSLDLDAPFIRPKSLAEDSTPTIDVVKHAINFFKKRDVFFDAICLLQVTSPFRSLDFLESCLKKFREDKCDSLISVKIVPDHFNPHWCFEKNSDGYLCISTGDKKIITRRQELPSSFYRDGAVYISKTDVILKRNSFFGDKLSFLINKSNKHINIDTIDDWENAKKIINEGKK